MEGHHIPFMIIVLYIFQACDVLSHEELRMIEYVSIAWIKFWFNLNLLLFIGKSYGQFTEMFFEGTEQVKSSEALRPYAFSELSRSKSFEVLL